MSLSNSINYYEITGLKHAEELLRISQLAYSNGDISYVEFMQNTSQATETQLRYFELLNEYNESVIILTHLSPSK